MEFKIIEENIEINEESTPEVQLQDEAEFKNYLLFTLLDKHTKYQKELESYYVRFVDPKKDPKFAGTTAAVDAGDRIIYMSIYEVKKLKDKSLSPAQHQLAEDTMSYLIRHELLHSILKHQERAIVFIAQSKGWDPAALDPDQYEEVLRLRAKPDIIYRNYNGGIGKQTMDPITKEPGDGITTMNGAGDLELSKFYLDRDVELTDLFGGLLLDDHPAWINYSFEELMAALIAERRQIYRRLYKRVYGTMDQTKMAAGDADAFSIRSKKNSVYSEMKIIDPDDVQGVRLLSVYEYQMLPQPLKQMVHGSWLTGGFIEDGKGCIACLHSFWTDAEVANKTVIKLPEGNITDVAIVNLNTRADLFPVLVIPNLDLYDNVGQVGTVVSCLGHQWYVSVNQQGLLFPHSIGKSPFESTGSKKTYKNTLRNSVAQAVLNDWLDELKTDYKNKQG